MDGINAIPHLEADLQRKNEGKRPSGKKPRGAEEEKRETGHLPEPGHKIDTRA
jgi:hypothetical protein